MRKYRYTSSLFLAETTRGRAMPVFYDLHTSVANNKPPGCVITGAPGSGKTFLALTLTVMSSILGKTTVVLDPKGDFLSLVNLRKELGKFAIWNLAEGNTGMLDPFYMTNRVEEKISLAIEVIDLFVGGISGEELTALAPIVKDVAVDKNPSLQKVVDELRGSQDKPAQNLGAKLDLMRTMKFAKLCFAPGNERRKPVSLTEGLTIVSLYGLELPTAGSPPATNQERLALGIIFLVTDFIRRIMMVENTKNPKTIVIDEAHVVLGSDQGARTVKSLALLGRSKNLALVLISQNNSHLARLDIDNTISSRFAFKTTRGEAETIIEDMNLPLGEGLEDVLLTLETGECLMMDCLERYATVQISDWKKDWSEAFETNPLIKQERRKRERE